jgi:hypothetical protein
LCQDFRPRRKTRRPRCPDFPPGLPSCEGRPSDHPACPPVLIIQRLHESKLFKSSCLLRNHTPLNCGSRLGCRHGCRQLTRICKSRPKVMQDAPTPGGNTKKKTRRIARGPGK